MTIPKGVIYKAIIWLLFLSAVIFYDLTLPLINAILTLKINILGFFLEPVLQSAFDLSLREAQIMSAWIYLIATTLLFWYFFRKAYLLIATYIYSARQFWLGISNLKKAAFSLVIISVVIAIGKSVLVFF